MLLAIDTATFRASIALHDGIALRGECTWEAANAHTVTLAAHIADLLRQTEITVTDLKGIAVCIGPGSYTGVRIGMAMAKGLALSQQLPLVGVPTLDILAEGQPPDDRPLYAIFAAGRRRVGYARYQFREGGWHVATEIALASWEELLPRIETPALVVGEIDAPGRKALESLGVTLTLPPAAWHLRRAGFLAEIAWRQLRKRARPGQTEVPAQLVPLYASGQGAG
ncbi:MAG: tRNA (adenosine(37)-N6)-threonylcarbamoyltransferase complex dimerization subunit type 1 TsaB [Anaerolineae bacterium]|jgi:tRNA threonylcarbamoyladenosine biosynthesis protein TsaB|nr:tRNA (adenosine(37)-N6)-threonylcarbamoyltransferase complex dimerization subunit type 1 TsaB [Anaerolineae bacterium]